MIVSTVAFLIRTDVRHEPCDMSPEKMRNTGCTMKDAAIRNAAMMWGFGTYLDSPVTGKPAVWAPIHAPDACMARVIRQLDQRELLSANTTHLPGTRNLMLLGDSLDRYVVLAACDLLQTTPVDWTGGAIAYRDAYAGLLCSSANLNVSFVHLYGSRQKGPYLHGEVNSKIDPYTDTPLRIAFAIERIANITGARPDFVVYQTSLWDARSYNKPAYRGLRNVTQLDVLQAIFTKYHHNTVHNVKLIKSMLSTAAPVILRTTPEPLNLDILFTPDFNHAIRQIGLDHCLPVLDWASMASFATRTHSFFRDKTHPTQEFSSLFARTILDFSSYLRCMSLTW